MNQIQSHFMMMKSVITSPKKFFDGISDREPYGKVLVFALINFVLYALITIVLYVLSLNININNSGMTSGAIGSGMVVIGALFMLPLFLVGLFIGAGILHVIAKILGGKGAYQGTFSVVGYTTAITPLTAIPILGLLISLYGIYIQIVGLRKIHKYSTARAVVTILIPVFLIGILVAGAVTLGVLAALSLFKNSNISPADLQNLQNVQQMTPEELQNQMMELQNQNGTQYQYDDTTYPTGYESYEQDSVIIDEQAQ